MAQAFKCDRCKQLKEGMKKGVANIYEDNPKDEFGIDIYFDLCDSCFSDVIKYTKDIPS
jgi:hypothetical protein